MATFQANPADTILYQPNPTTNLSTSTVVNVGCYTTASAINRGVLKFDLSSIPASASVSAATLTMEQIGDYSDNNVDLIGYRVLQAVVIAQTTWNIYSTGNNWATAGCGSAGTDYENSTLCTRAFSSTEANGSKEWTLNASMVQEWISGAFTNNGLMMKSSSEAVNTEYQFASTENATAAYRPYITVTYTSGSAAVFDHHNRMARR